MTAQKTWVTLAVGKITLGTCCQRKGNKIKVNSINSIQACGLSVDYPYPIALKAGWNIIGYPQTVSFDGNNIVQQLIDRGKLIKVQDEKGISIEDWGVYCGWTNGIGNFLPGEGYKIKVNADDTLWIYDSYPKSSLIFPPTFR